MPRDIQEDIGGQLRHALRRLAGTVCIIATRHESKRYGLTATAVTSLSMNPPALLVCINRSGETHNVMCEGQLFSVNLLCAGQEAVSRSFSSGTLKGELRFVGAEWEEADDQVPRLRNANASVLCRVDQVAPYGSHTIFIGRVIDVRLAPTLTPPLIYYEGRYATVFAQNGIDSR